MSEVLTLLQRTHKDYLTIKEKIQALQIVNDETLAFAAESAATAKRIAKIVDENRVKEKEPHLQAGKEVDAKHFAIIKPCNELAEQIEAKMREYQRKLREEEARRHQEAIQKQIEAERLAMVERQRLEAERAKLAKANAKKDLPPPPPVVAPTVPQYVPPPAIEIPKAVETSFGTMKIGEKWDYEVVDLSKVPIHFLIADDKRIKAAIKAGQHTIAGLRIFEK